jgi:N6-adenosine-specific RNA methylase IME4
MTILDELLPDYRSHFGAILIDAPWRFATWSENGRGRSAERHYGTLSDAELEGLPIAELAADDSCVFLWSSGPFLARSLRLMEAWGFAYKTVAFNWIKAEPLLLFAGPPMGPGYWTRPASEFVLLGTRGRPRRRDRAVRQVIVAPRREHSRKPGAVQQGIERLVPGPYLELFARQSRDGWTTFGDEREKFDVAAEMA